MKRSRDAMKLVCLVGIVVWGCAAERGGGSPQAQAPAVAAAPAPPRPPAEPPLTNKDVIDLSNAGLGDAVVIAKIKQAPQVAFELGPKDLQKVNNNKVSKGVIAAMLERSGGGSSDAALASGGAAAAPRGAFSGSGKVWVQNGGQLWRCRAWAAIPKPRLHKRSSKYSCSASLTSLH